MTDLVIAEYEEIANVADAIRSKTGKTEQMSLSQMATNVMSISSSDIIIDSELSTESTNPVQNKVVAKEIRQLSEEIVDLKEQGTGATEEQIRQIEKNKNDIVAISKDVDDLKQIEHNIEKKYTIDICNIKNPSQTIGGDTNNLCLIATRSIQEFDKMPDCTGYLYYEKSTKKLYYSSVTPDNPVYLCDWNTSLANSEEAKYWMASITADGDIVFLKYKERRNPIIYPHDNYNAPYVVDFGNEFAPYGYLMASSIVQFEDGSFVFGDYASHSVEEETNLNPRNIWRVTKPYNDVSNWNVCHSFKHVHFSSNESNEPDNEIGHIHAISYDWYSGVTYCNTGDIDRHCRIWKSMDKGITWSAIDGAVGTNKKPNIYDDGQKWRTASFVFTKDFCYWGTDSFFEKHVLYRCVRNSDGEVDFSTIEKVCSLEPNNSTVHTQATYGHVLLRNPNGIIFLDRGEPRTDGFLDITFYSFDDEELYICGTLERATTDIGSSAYEGETRIGLPNQCGTYYQPQCLDYALIGGVYIRANNTSLFDNSVENYVGALKLKVNEIGITQVTHQSFATITKQPVNAIGEIGDVITFSIEATGDGLTYKWYTMPDDKKWYVTNITGQNTNTLTVELNESRIKYLYKCIVTDKYGNSVESNVVKVGESPSEPEPETLSIIKQPTKANGNIGDTVTFSVEATGNGLTYQWYAIVDDTQYWHEATLSGNKTNKLYVEITEARLQNLYKCIVTDSNGNSIESDVVCVLIPLEINQQPVDVEGNIGDAITFTVKANGNRITYQWWTSTDNGNTWMRTGITGNYTDTLTVELTSSRISYLYKCVITDWFGDTIETNVVKVIENSDEPETEIEALSIVKQPINTEGDIGDIVTFSVGATGTGLTYQWYANILEEDRVTTNWYKTSYAGNNTDTLTVELTEARMSNKYKCVITDLRGNTLESDVVWVSKPLEITQQPVDTQGAIGDTVTFSVKASGFRLKYQWYTSTNNGASWIATGITGSATDTLIVELNSSRITYLYKCVISDDNGNSVETSIVKVI